MNRSGMTSILNWSFCVGRLFGIPINLHISLAFFLFPLLTGSRLDFGHGLEYVVAVVLCILHHELGHALAARHYRLTGLSIMLHGFGGFAVSRGIRSPTQALVISLAGPAVTFVIGGLFLGLGTLGQSRTVIGTEAEYQFYMLAFLGSFNLMLGVLNMVPSLPFDGGHALQAILNRRRSEFKAMRAVAHLGLIVSALLAFAGLWFGYGLATIFGLIGLMTSWNTLRNSGGIKFGETFADRREMKEAEQAKKRKEEQTAAYLGDVRAREREREERERLRKLFESSLDDEQTPR